MSLQGAYSGMGIGGMNGYVPQSTMSLTDQLQNSFNRVQAGQSGNNPNHNITMAGGYQANSDSMGIIKSSDINGSGNILGKLGSALGGMGKATGGFGGVSTDFAKFTPQPTLQYSMEDYVKTLPTKMQYPHYYFGSK